MRSLFCGELSWEQLASGESTFKVVVMSDAFFSIFPTQIHFSPIEPKREIHQGGIDSLKNCAYLFYALKALRQAFSQELKLGFLNGHLGWIMLPFGLKR